MCAFNNHPVVQQMLAGIFGSQSAEWCSWTELLEEALEIQSIGARAPKPKCYTPRPFDTCAAGRAAGGGVGDTAAAAAAR